MTAYSDSSQVVHTNVPPSPSSIIWYRSKDGDVLGWKDNRAPGGNDSLPTGVWLQSPACALTAQDRYQLGNAFIEYETDFLLIYAHCIQFYPEKRVFWTVPRYGTGTSGSYGCYEEVAEAIDKDRSVQCCACACACAALQWLPGTSGFVGAGK